MAEVEERRRQRLGQHVMTRRKELGLSVREAARRAGVMRATWTGLEQGSRRTADYNFAAVERVLEWQPGSLARVAEGGDPTPVAAAPPTAVEVSAGQEPADAGFTSVLWSDLVDILDAHLGALGRAASVDSSQRLWAAERITVLVRRLRQRRVDNGGGARVNWPDVVGALEGVIADIRQDAAVGSETRLWGVEMIVDIAVSLRAAQTSLDAPLE
jgi:transcriptional regulator with XRE-family HTH domain